MAGTLTVDSLLSQVSESTRRISELVAAVKSYSQMDRAAMQQIDVTEGLESTLIMLGHKLRDGVVVVRDYSPGLPAIEAYPGELNQVWTNLIDNAVDAMDGPGTLRVSARAMPEHVVVEIADTGAGMPPVVADRAFEAFYTTKDVGKGTGLGDMPVGRQAHAAGTGATSATGVDEAEDRGRDVGSPVGYARDEDHRVVTGDGPDHVGPVGAVDRRGEVLGTARRRAQHHDVGRAVDTDQDILGDLRQPRHGFGVRGGAPAGHRPRAGTA